MQRSRSSDLFAADHKIDRTYSRILKEKKDREIVIVTNYEEKKALRDYAIISLIGVTSCIKKLTISANTFELKAGVIQLVQNECQLGGLPNDDLN